jgi:hypothetical protein
MDGQAEAPASLDDLAAMLDTPEEESTETEQPAVEGETADEPTLEEDTGEEASDEQEEVEPDEPAPVEKLTIKVKGDDGQEETLEVTPEEVAASYLRQKDYTKKTQALAQRETEAVQFITQKHQEIQSQYLQQAETLREAIVGLAGIKSEDEMVALATSDPAAWVAEQQRQRQLSAYLNSINQKIDSEKQAKAEAEQRQQAQRIQSMYQQSWDVLGKEGIDKPKLAKIYESMAKTYGLSDNELGTIYDARYVKIMRDAAAYQALKAQKPEVTKKLANAPRLPSKQTPPAQERLNRELDNKFKSGKAKLSDLAALLR